MNKKVFVRVLKENLLTETKNITLYRDGNLVFSDTCSRDAFNLGLITGQRSVVYSLRPLLNDDTLVDSLDEEIRLSGARFHLDKEMYQLDLLFRSSDYCKKKAKEIFKAY